MYPSTLLLLGWLSGRTFSPPAAAADATTAPGARPDEKEVEAFMSSAQRYRDRMEEVRADIRSYIAYMKEQDFNRVSGVYQQAYIRMLEEDTALRRVAIARMDAFLRKYPGAPEVPDVMYRLADLYLEESEVAFQSELGAWRKLEAQALDNPAIELPPEPEKNFSSSIELYRAIMERYPDSSIVPNAMSNLAWCFNSINVIQYDPVAAKDVNLAILKEYPGTTFADDAAMRLGEYYFDQLGPREDPTKFVRVAIGYYQQVYQRGEQSPFYDKAIYKLGWSSYKTNNYTQALKYLVELLNYSQNLYLKTGEQSDMRQEAVIYLAIAYADISEAAGRSPVDVVKDHMNQLGAAAWQHDVAEQLADTLLRKALFDDAIVVYSWLQQQWPLHPSNPIYQYKIAQIYAGRRVEITGLAGPQQVSGMPVPDPVASTQAMSRLGSLYTEGKPWAQANQDNPEALALAREFIEGSLTDLAYDYLVVANQSKRSEDYAVAAEKMREFLDAFPFSEKYDEYQWYYGYSLYFSNQFPLAEDQFRLIVRNDRSKHKDGARFLSMKCKEQIAVSAYGGVTVKTPDAVLEQQVTTPFNQQVAVYTVPEKQQAVIAAYDDLVDRQMSEEEFVAMMEDARPKMAYLPGEILYNYGRYADARARFEAFLKRYPKSDEALIAVQVILDMYNREGDVESLGANTNRFLQMLRAGEIGTTPEKVSELIATLTDVREKVFFERARRLVEAQKYLEAAQVYQEHMRSFPNSLLFADSLYNAANNYARGGQIVTANQLYEQFIAKYPTDPRSEKLYFQIAGNYSRILELNRAIQNYDLLVQNFPQSTDAPAALYNASFLRVGIGDYAGAARGYERYATQYPDEEDAEEIFWRAGPQWALVSDAQALDFYNRYLRRYELGNPDHVIEAWYRMAKIYEKRGDRARAAAAWQQLQDVFGSNASRVALQSKKYAVEQPLRLLLSRVEEIKKVKWTKDQTKDVAILLAKLEEIKVLDAAANQLAATYAEPESVFAVYYIKGLIRFYVADLVYAVPMPSNFNEDEIAEYQALLDEKIRIPMEDAARKWLEEGIRIAKEQKLWYEWNSRAQTLLHDRFPFDYAGERPESRGQLGTSDTPMGGPASPIEEEAAPAPESPAPGPAPAPAPGGTP